MRCPKCGNEYEGKFCPECGLAADYKVFCPKCGTQHNRKFCPECGTPAPDLGQTQQRPQQPPQPQQPAPVIINNVTTNVVHTGREKNKWVALLLCFFFGFAGAHKFYEGKIGMGVLYFFTVGLFGIGVVVDFITLLFKPNPYYV